MVPGGFGTRALMAPNPLLDWIRAAHETSRWTTSVCTGSMLLAAAGILDGLEATTRVLRAGPPAAPAVPEASPHVSQAPARGTMGRGPPGARAPWATGPRR
jgi:putative intracellular protease/amidase